MADYNYKTAISYVSLEEVPQLVESSQLVQWNALEGDSDKTIKLVNASSYIDNLYNYKYSKTDDEQFLEFPRNGETTVPREIKLAVLEVVLFDLKNKDNNKNLKRKKVGPLEAEYSKTTNEEFEETILMYLRKYISSTVTMNIGY